MFSRKKARKGESAQSNREADGTRFGARRHSADGQHGPRPCRLGPGRSGRLLCGGGLTLLLAALRMRLLAFPFHPVGYVLANTLTLNAFFIPFLLAWLVKVLVQRLGGSVLYCRSLAFFVGLILGDIVTQAGWTIVGRVLEVPIYQFLS